LALGLFRYAEVHLEKNLYQPLHFWHDPGLKSEASTVKTRIGTFGSMIETRSLRKRKPTSRRFFVREEMELMSYISVRRFVSVGYQLPQNAPIRREPTAFHIFTREYCPFHLAPNSKKPLGIVGKGLGEIKWDSVRVQVPTCIASPEESSTGRALPVQQRQLASAIDIDNEQELFEVAAS
jgi:hypothetical protein